MTRLLVDYAFYPVGQGLFSSGSVAAQNSTNGTRSLPFRWVYDCGTTSSQRYVRNAIGTFKGNVGTQRLDLIIVSHFDTDHISGLVQLLNEVGTKTLMLPWAPLAHRLVIGFEQDIAPDDPEMLFYVDPVTYLSNAAPEGFDEVLFVGFGDDEGPPDPEDDDRPVDFDPEGPLRLKYLRDEKWESSEKQKATAVDSNISRNVNMLQSGSALSILGLWEFVPYNDPKTRPKQLGTFQKVVDHLRNNLLSAHEDATKQALNSLKAFYVRTFPKSQLNDLSLFLYAGPIGSWATYAERPWYGYLVEGPASVIYTGDGNLGSSKRWHKLSSYIGTKRSYHPCVFQVPHHGSKKNWHDGLADLLNPTLSVFSSDPTHRGFGHPHGKVIRDFWQHHVVQVDKSRSFDARLYLTKLVPESAR
jgi:hypothetical protein